MKYIIAILLVVFLVGCSAGEIVEQQAVEEAAVEEPAVEEVPKVSDPLPLAEDVEETVEEPVAESAQDYAALCKSLCNKDKQAYCVEERTIIVGGTSVRGTCRAFARKGNVEGYSKCPGYCKGVDGSSSACTVDGKQDFDCDGKA